MSRKGIQHVYESSHLGVRVWKGNNRLRGAAMRNNGVRNDNTCHYLLPSITATSIATVFCTIFGNPVWNDPPLRTEAWVKGRVWILRKWWDVCWQLAHDSYALSGPGCVSSLVPNGIVPSRTCEWRSPEQQWRPSLI